MQRSSAKISTFGYYLKEPLSFDVLERGSVEINAEGSEGSLEICSREQRGM